MKRLFAALIVAILPFSAMAQNTYRNVPVKCFDSYEEVLNTFSELPKPVKKVATGLAHFVGTIKFRDAVLVEVFLAKDGSFSMLTTDGHSGKACAIVIGPNWETIDETIEFKDGRI